MFDWDQYRELAQKSQELEKDLEGFVYGPARKFLTKLAKLFDNNVNISSLKFQEKDESFVHFTIVNGMNPTFDSFHLVSHLPVIVDIYRENRFPVVLLEEKQEELFFESVSNRLSEFLEHRKSVKFDSSQADHFDYWKSCEFYNLMHTNGEHVNLFNHDVWHDTLITMKRLNPDWKDNEQVEAMEQFARDHNQYLRKLNEERDLGYEKLIEAKRRFGWDVVNRWLEKYLDD